MNIKNRNKLEKNNLRKKALDITEAGLSAINTEKAVKNGVFLDDNVIRVNDRSFDIKNIKNIYLIAIGKCAAEAALAIENIIGERISVGVVIDVCEPPNLKYTEFFKGTHPFPSEGNKEATDKIINLLHEADKDDFVIFVISGGGSTILHSSGDISPEEETKMIERLFEAGANIEEINTIRKHISLGRGGNLAKYSYPAKSVSLIFSDVPSNDIQFIASGPTVKDKTSIKDAERVLSKYDVLNKCNMEGCGLMETPKEEKYFENVENIIFVSNKTALNAMKNKAENLGFHPEICNSCLTGEAKIVGKNMVEDLHKRPPGTVMIYGGETTVTVNNNGKGGRNQELALSALTDIKEGELIISIASDGEDNTEHAGALCDKITKKEAENLNLNPSEYLKKHDSFNFFKETGSYIETGITGSNVADLVLAIKENE